MPLKRTDSSLDDQRDDIVHSLWLIYSNLKDVELSHSSDLLESTREDLGRVLNMIYSSL